MKFIWEKSSFQDKFWEVQYTGMTTENNIQTNYKLLIILFYPFCFNVWVFRGFQQYPDEFRDSTKKLAHEPFLPNPFQFIIHLSPFHSTLYSLRQWKASLNQLQINKTYPRLRSPVCFNFYTVLKRSEEPSDERWFMSNPESINLAIRTSGRYELRCANWNTALRYLAVVTRQTPFKSYFSAR
jgi:hypothetical protein